MDVTLRRNQDGSLNPNENGTPHLEYKVDPATTGLHPILTGPHAKGRVTLKDGTVYDITPELIVAKLEHHPEILALCNKAAEAAGVTTFAVALDGTRKVDATGSYVETPYVAPAS